MGNHISPVFRMYLFVPKALTAGNDYVELGHLFYQCAHTKIVIIRAISKQVANSAVSA